MRCVSCGFENPEGMKFCGVCAAPLKPHCPQCGFENPPGFKFCGECATPLSASDTHGLQRAAVHQPAKPTTKSDKRGRGKTQQPKTERSRREVTHRAPEAERRQLTVMFCDLVGSTALSEQLDPEEWREVVQTYQGTCAEVVSRFDGHIAQYLGDGLLIYFGYPSAHEGDAQRAVRVALGIVDVVQHAPLLQAHGVQVRLGIHTGLVVVGEIGSGRREQLALGDTPNIAARLQGLAEPNTVFVNVATHRLIAGFFDCHDGGLQSLKGVSAPVQVYRVLSESSTQSRLEIEVGTGRLTPLVGRSHEVGLILERWTAAQGGDGQVVLLNGEPGIGKSRLVQEVKERLIQQEAMCLEFRFSLYSK